jgi:Ni,Fe-hydrogenase I cytochrome b subunit
MSIIEPVRRETATPFHIKKNSASLRLWHWANTVVISGSLITVLINSTITNQRKTLNLVKDKLQAANVNFNIDQAVSIAHALSNRVWSIHVYFGYFLTALLLFRFILEFFQLADQKFIRKFKNAYIQFNTIKKNREAARHELAVQIIYSAFYVVLIIMALTGLCLAFEGIAFLKPFRHSIKKVHNLGMYLILAFIVVHLLGVFLAERKDAKGIVSDMINGGGQS